MDTETVTVTMTKWEWERVKHALFVYKVDALLEEAMASHKVYGKVLEKIESQVATTPTAPNYTHPESNAFITWD